MAAPSLAWALELVLALDASPDPEAGRWLWPAGVSQMAAQELWDAEPWHALSAHLAQSARDTGALVLLQFGLISLVVPHLLAGELATAGRLIEEDRLIAEATGNPPVAYTAMTLAAWRGQETPATELIQVTMQEAAARGQGRLVSLADYASSVLGNGLGRHDAARDAAWRAFQRDPLGYGPFIVPELAEAAARTADVKLVGAALDWLSERTAVTPTDWSLGVEARVRAFLSEGEAAERLYRESIARLGRRVRPMNQPAGTRHLCVQPPRRRCRLARLPRPAFSAGGKCRGLRQPPRLRPPPGSAVARCRPACPAPRCLDPVPAASFHWARLFPARPGSVTGTRMSRTIPSTEHARADRPAIRTCRDPLRTDKISYLDFMHIEMDRARKVLAVARPGHDQSAWPGQRIDLNCASPTETALLDPQPPRRSGRDTARVVLLMFEAKLPHALVVALGEYGPPGLAHACDRGDRRLEKLAPGQFVAGAVLEQAKLPAGRREGQRRSRRTRRDDSPDGERIGC